MPAALTTGSTITCSHQGTVQLSSSAKLKAGGKAVLLESSLGAIPDCPNQTSSTTKDKKVASVTAGVATKLKADGNGVVLASLAGQGDGSPPGTLSATADQSKLVGS
jgi:hypothetical protein